MLFQPTRPAGESRLMRASTFQRRRESVHASLTTSAAVTRLSMLGRSLVQDLARFEDKGRETELLEVLAASVRHSRSLLVHLQCDDHVLPLTVFPADWLVHTPVAMDELMAWPLADLRVLHYETPAMPPPGSADFDPEKSRRLAPLGPLLWELALRGGRAALLPEIAGVAAYRVAPGVELRSLPLSGSLGMAVQRLRRETRSLREIAGWPAFDAERAARLLNALYLQAGLIVSRSHPAAIAAAA
jgi:hypothetical protein